MIQICSILVRILTSDDVKTVVTPIAYLIIEIQLAMSFEYMIISACIRNDYPSYM